MAVATQAPTTVSPPRRRERLKSGWVLPVYSILMIFYLTIPVFLMILYGFNDLPGNAERQTTHFWGFTLHWYLNPFQDPQLTEAFWRSIRIAGGNVLLATPIGALLGLALGRYWFRVRASLNFVIFLAIAVLGVLLGSSLSPRAPASPPTLSLSIPCTPPRPPAPRSCWAPRSSPSSSSGLSRRSSRLRRRRSVGGRYFYPTCPSASRSSL